MGVLAWLTILKNQFLGYLNLFSGGAMGNMSVAALGVFQYITASIVIQLLTPVIPQLQEISNEGTQGGQKIGESGACSGYTEEKTHTSHAAAGHM